MNSSLSNSSVISSVHHSWMLAKNFNVANLRDDVIEQIDETLENRVTKKVQDNWKDFTTIEKWKAHFDEHPEWHGLSTYDMQKDKNGGGKFYQAFSKWRRKESKGDEVERKRITESIFPSLLNSWDFITIDEWTAYFDEHPELHGKGTGWIRKKEVEGGEVFYQVFYNWCKKESKGDEVERKRLIETIFPPLRNSWENFTTIEKWKAHFDEHTEWHGKGTDWIIKIEGGFGFYSAFSKWCKKESKGDETERKRLTEIIFPPLYSNWDFATIEEWTAYFDVHPEWHEKGTGQIQKKEIEGGNAFYQAFSKWCKKVSKGDETERKRLMETIFPPLLNNWDFATIEEWKAHFDEYTEWHKQGTGWIKKIEGGLGFYSAFSKWCKKESKGDEVGRKRLIETIFPPLLNSWDFTTVEEWKSHFDEHPDWHRKGTSWIRKIEDGVVFYQAFYKWSKKASKGDEEGRKWLIETIFPPLRNSWEDLTTIEEWKVYFDEHPEWHEQGTGWIKKIEGGSGFYASFNNWCKEESKGDETERKRLTEIIFPPLHNNWDYTTIDEWKTYFDEHPEWHGKGTKWIQKIEGGSGFYASFNNWCKEESKGDETERRRLMEVIFPIRGYKCSFQFDDGNMCTFDSYPERLTGILLYSLGMIKKFEEGKNLHIRTNGSKWHSVDFKVGDVFLEYHPVSLLEWRKWMNFNDAAKKKHDHITDPKYLHRTNLYVFDEIDTLYDIILNDPELRFYVSYPYFWPDFGKKEWNTLVYEVYRKVNEYDKENPRKKK